MNDRILPDREDPLSAPFWAATRDHKLVMQRCRGCGYIRWPPGPLCPECLVPGGEWINVTPTGVLWSFAIYHRALAPAFASRVPYAVGLVELNAGPRMIGTMIGDLHALAVDQPVQGVFVEVSSGVTYLEWEPLHPDG